MSAHHFTFGRHAEVTLEQVRELRRLLVLTGQSLTPLGFAPLQALPSHRVGDGVHTDRPAGLEQIGVDPRRAVGALGCLEHLEQLNVHLGPTPLARGGRPVKPLVQPGHTDPEDHAAHRVRDAAEGPLVGDETCHAHFVASFTHRTTERFSTSRSIRSSATSLRSHFSSSMSAADRPSAPSRSARSLAYQLPSVPSLIPRSRATCAIGFPVSRTIRTAPSRNSRSNFLRFSGMTTPHSPCLHGLRGGSALVWTIDYVSSAPRPLRASQGRR